MFAALADGTSEIDHFLAADDCLSTVRAFQALGIPIDQQSSGKLVIQGRGMHGLTQPASEIDAGNSGTTMRLLLGILAGQPFISTLSGDPSLSKRPMKRVTEPLRRMGAKIQGPEDANFPPLTIKGGELRGIEFTHEIASAQVKSAVLLAGLFAEGKTRVKETLPSRDHTERMIQLFGGHFTREKTVFTVQKTERLHPQQLVIPGDISSAAFFVVGALLVPDSEVVLRGVGLNPTRRGYLNLLEKMGGRIMLENFKEGWEPTADLRVFGSALTAAKVTKRLVPALIDELPVLMVAFALAEGRSELHGAEELRVKETDRIKAMCENLARLGVKVKELPDGCVIQGRKELEGGTVDSFGDHRIAMAFAMAALRAKGPVKITGSECCSISYPSFFKDLERLKRA